MLLMASTLSSSKIKKKKNFKYYDNLVNSKFCVKNSIQFYPINLEGPRGTTDDFATILFDLVLFSAALVELAMSIPVHSFNIVFPPFFPSTSSSFHCAMYNCRC